MKRITFLATTLLILAIVSLAQQPAQQPKKGKYYPVCFAWPPLEGKLVIKVVITVSPEDKKREWTFSEAPAVVAQRILAGLNADENGLQFKEANGEKETIDIDVFLSETHEGTQRDSAFALVAGPPYPTGGHRINLFSAKSGEAPFTSWQAAADHVSSNILAMFKMGFHNNPPCLEEDGTLRK